MAQLTRVTMPGIGSQFVGAVAGTSPAWAAMVNGDLFPISSGRGSLLGFRTAGTVITITLNSVILTAYGTDVDPVITMGATDEQWVWIPNDGVGRFDQGAGANAGFMAVTYSVVTAGTRAVVTIP